MTSPFLSLATQAAKSRGAYNDAKAGAQKTARDESFKNAIAMLQAKRQAEQDALAKQLGMANLGKLGAETQALQNKPVTPLRDYVKEHQAIRDYDIEHPLPTKTKPSAPLLGSPEYLAAQQSLEKMRSKYRPPPQSSYTFPVVTDEAGKPVVARANTKTGEIEPTDVGARATAGGGMGGATIKKALSTNQQQVSVIDDALHELDAYPNAVGLQRGLSDRLDQRIDPKGVAARAAIANIGSLQIHDRTGAAMQVREEARLAPFVPSVNDTPATIKTKLKKLRDAIQVETDALQGGAIGGGRGGSNPKAPSGNIDLRAPAPKSSGGRTITVNGKTFKVPE